MKKKILALGSLLMLTGCCSQRKPIIVERKTYIYLSDTRAINPHSWHPQTRRDSLFWEASREAMKSAIESARLLYAQPVWEYELVK